MQCPRCKKNDTVKAGKVFRKNGMNQRYVCKHCFHYFIMSPEK